MKINQDTLLGLFFAVTGIVAVAIALQYPFGTAGRMGPGYFPIIVSSLLVVTGIFVLVRSVKGSAEMLEAVPWKPLVLVPGAVLLFGLVVETLGLLIALLLLLIVSAATSAKFRLDWKALAGAAAFAGLCAFVFVNLLGLPIPIIGSWLQGLAF